MAETNDVAPADSASTRVHGADESEVATAELGEIRDFERHLDAFVGRTPTGAVLLLELHPRWPLQLQWLDQQVGLLAPGAIRRSAGDRLVAALVPDASLAEAFWLREQLLDRAKGHHLTLFTGLASWPVQGSTAMDLLAAAAAALVDQEAAYELSIGDELRLELDEGERLALDVAGEFLTG